ncbi:MAG: DUF1700 domain-containing protein [Ruminococcaceae bacterium]|nr:DUF1700 domain-containing protein [Oscillospiraceae bacterium]
MTKLQFLLLLHEKLAHLPPDDVEEHLNFYSEMIEDRMEEGLSEEEAVAAVGDVDEIAAQIAENLPPSDKPAKQPRRLKAWEIVLLAVGSPVWVSLLVAAAAVAAALYVSLWAVIVSLWAVFGSLVGGGFCGVAVGVGWLLSPTPLTGFALLGAGLACVGLSIPFFLGCRAATVGTLRLTRRLLRRPATAWDKPHKRVKTWCIAAAVLCLVGVGAFLGSMTAMGWNFTRLSTEKYETNDHRITEDFKAISITTNTADIQLVPAEDETVSVRCCESSKLKHTVSVENGTLCIAVADTRKWYDYIGIHFGTPKITVSLPQGDYGALSITTDTGAITLPKAFAFQSIRTKGSTGNVTVLASAVEEMRIRTKTGNICLDGVSADSLDLSVSTGKVTASHVTCNGAVTIGVSTGKTHLANVRCQSLASGGSTGNLRLTDVIAAADLTIERTTGDVVLDGCDAAEITVITDTGDVSGTLLSDKVFLVSTDTGRVDVPKSISGGRCEISTDTGDVRLQTR